MATHVRMSTLPADCWKGGHSPDPDAPRPNLPTEVRDMVVIRRRPGRAEVRVPRGQAQLNARSRVHWSEGEKLIDLLNT